MLHTLNIYNTLLWSFSDLSWRLQHNKCRQVAAFMSESLLSPSFNPFVKTTGINLMMRRFLIAYKHAAIAISAILEVVNEYAILNLDAVFVIESKDSFKNTWPIY